jgi:hypothetical protein
MLFLAPLRYFYPLTLSTRTPGSSGDLDYGDVNHETTGSNIPPICAVRRKMKIGQINMWVWDMDI